MRLQLQHVVEENTSESSILEARKNPSKMKPIRWHGSYTGY